MIRFVTIVLVNLLCGIVSAQQIYFSKNYQVFNTTNNLGTVVQKPDSGYYFVTTNSAAIYGYSVISANKYGDTLFSKNYVFNQMYVGVGQGTHALIPTQDGNYIASGNTLDTNNNRDGYIVKFTSAGDTVWSRRLGGAGFDVFNTIYEDAQGVVWACGSTWSSGNGDGDIWLVRIDANGIILSDTTFGTVQNETALCAQFTLDGGFIISGYQTNCPYVLKLDASRSVEWEYAYCNYNGFGFVSQLNDSEYVVACCDILTATETQACLFKLDSEGQEVWVRHFGFALNEEVLWGKPIILADGIVVTGTSQPPADYPGAFLAKTDINGYMIWQRRYTINPNSYQETFNVIPTSDNGFLLSGYCIIGNQDAWLLKVDSLGCDSMGCDGVGIIEDVMHDGMYIYPNPASEYVTLEYSEAPNYAVVQILNVHGQMIEHIPLINGRAMISVSDYAEGMYFLRVACEGEYIATEKLMITH